MAPPAVWKPSAANGWVPNYVETEKEKAMVMASGNLLNYWMGISKDEAEVMRSVASQLDFVRIWSSQCV